MVSHLPELQHYMQPIPETLSDSLSDSRIHLQEEFQIQKRDWLSTVIKSSQQTEILYPATPEGQPSCRNHTQRPTSCRPVRDTTFDIEQLSKISQHTSNTGTYRYRYHNEIPQKAGDLSIINPPEDSVVLPSLHHQGSERFPPIRNLIPELQTRWQANPSNRHSLMRN